MNISEKYISNLKQFSIDNRKIKSLDGDNELTHIVFEDGEKVKIDGIFIANNMPNIDELSTSLGVITKDNKIVSDENNMTNIEGVYACGDMINNFKQVSTAVGSGAIAAHSCIKYLVNLVKEEEMKVQIYTTSTCHWCRAAKEYFKNKGIKYEEFNVELDHDKAVELVNISGQRSVPVIIVDEQIIIGFDKETLDKIFDKKENK